MSKDYFNGLSANDKARYVRKLQCLHGTVGDTFGILKKLKFRRSLSLDLAQHTYVTQFDDVIYIYTK